MAKDEIEIIPIPPMTPTEQDLLLIEAGWTPRKLMTRAEIDERYPGVKPPLIPR